MDVFGLTASLMPVGRIIHDVAPNLESRSVATTVLNTSIEVKKHVWGLDDADPSAPNHMVVYLSFIHLPHHS